MKKTIISSVLVLAFAVVCVAADLTGNRKGMVKTPTGDLDITYKLKVEGENLTGVIASSYGDLPITDGKVKADSFFFNLPFGENTIDQKGRFMGDSIVVETKMMGNVTKSTFKRVAQ